MISFLMYPNINNYLFNDFIQDIGVYVVNYCNKEIPFFLLYQTILNIYSKINALTEKDYQTKLIKLQNKNEIDYYNSFIEEWPYDMEHRKI